MGSSCHTPNPSREGELQTPAGKIFNKFDGGKYGNEETGHIDNKYVPASYNLLGVLSTIAHGGKVSFGPLQ